MTSTNRGFRTVLAFLGMLALALATVVAGPLSKANAASSLQVFVGYAVNLRANPTDFPTPWNGSPGVIFQGCQGSCTFDGGAVRFVNNSPVNVTVNTVSLTLDTCTWAMWPSNTVLAPGQQLIIDQTASGAASGCDNTHGWMDTSDVGPGGQSWDDNCNQSGVVPVINATIDGLANTFVDTGQVLNTDGVDKAGCPAGSNESEQWTQLGSVACPGSTLVLSPSSQTVPIGSTATETATFADSCGVGLQGAAIAFAVASGPNAGLTGTAVTNSSGVATFPYTSTATGTDTLSASTSNPAGTITSNSATVLWTKRTSQLTITGGASSSDYNDPATVAGTLTDGLGPIAGQTVAFALNGAETCSATTNASGQASCSLTPGEAAGHYTLTAAFAGDASDLASSASAPFTVTTEETTLTYTGPVQAANGQPLTLTSVLKEDGTTPIAGRTVTDTIGSGSSAQSCSGVTNAAGQASCTIALVSQPSGTTSIPIATVFAGDAYYQPASASATARFLYLTGRAYGLESTGLVTISPTPDTGEVQTATASNTTPPCVANISGLIAAHTLCASVVTTLNPGTSTATASVQGATIGVLGLPVIQLGVIQSSSQTTCAGSAGNATITSITVGGVPVNVNIHPGPNTTVTVLGVTLVFNEQVPVPGGLQVNAVHISAAPLGLGLLDVKVASSTSDIHNC